MQGVWATVFGLDLGDLAGIYTHLVRLLDSVDEIEKAIQQQDVDHEVYLQHLPSIRGFLSLPNLDRNLASVRDILSESALMTLQFCSERLSKFCSETIPDPEEIAALLLAIEQFTEQVLGADIDTTLKALLLDLAESMRQALSEYRIRGGDGLRKEMFFVLDRLHRNMGVLERDRESLVMKHFWDLVTKYDTLTSICVNATPVIEGFRRALALPSSGVSG
jgi:hypothetical protein